MSDHEYTQLEHAFAQACMNLATIRPDLTREGFTLGDQADLWRDALLAGWGGIEGYDPGRTPADEAKPDTNLYRGEDGWLTNEDGSYRTSGWQPCPPADEAKA